MRTEVGSNIDLFDSKYIRLASIRSCESASILYSWPGCGRRGCCGR